MARVLKPFGTVKGMLADSTEDTRLTMHVHTAELRDFAPLEKKSTTLRVLVVDDEPLIRWSVAETLMDDGHWVIEAADGQSAIEELKSHLPIDVVMLDLKLPDSDDLRLLSAIRRLSPASRVILMTAYGTPEITANALQMGAARIVTKPFDLTDIREFIGRTHDRPVS
jgi:DNA-binding NtrC family response regulator